jgi:hypothetical protein
VLVTVRLRKAIPPNMDIQQPTSPSEQ